MQVIYRADDGTEFDDEFECADYEWRLNNKALDFVEFFDKDGNELKNKMTEETYNNVWVIAAPAPESVIAVNELGDYLGYDSYKDIKAPGLWRWEESEGYGGFFKQVG